MGAKKHIKAPVWGVAMGDSLTENDSCQVFPHDTWPALFQTKFNAHPTAAANKSSIRLKNLGKSGDTTGPYTGTTTYGMTVRLPAAYANAKQKPKLAIIFGGHNDASHAAQFVPLPANVHEEVTRANLVALGNAAFTSGSQYVIIVSRHVLNFAAGGDITGGAVNAAPSNASPALNLYAAQYNAAQDLIVAHPSVNDVPQVVFCDLYTYLRNHLIAPANAAQIGVDTYYHPIANNVHFNALGNQLVSDAIYDAIPAGWFAGLLA